MRKGLPEYAGQQLHEEVERDLPRQAAPAHAARVRPMRQMV